MYGVAIVGLRLRDNVLKVRLLQPNTGKQSVSGVLFLFLPKGEENAPKSYDYSSEMCIFAEKKVRKYV
jgi:hypothetical protein